MLWVADCTRLLAGRLTRVTRSGNTSSRRGVEGADGRGHGQTSFLAEDFNRSISLLSAICQSHSRRITRKEGAGRHQSPRKCGEDERAEEGGDESDYFGGKVDCGNMSERERGEIGEGREGECKNGRPEKEERGRCGSAESYWMEI